MVGKALNLNTSKAAEFGIIQAVKEPLPRLKPILNENYILATTDIATLDGLHG